jgi:hypothetical protein
VRSLALAGDGYREPEEKVRELNALPGTYSPGGTIGAGVTDTFADVLSDEFDVELARENDARELAIYGPLLMDMRLLRQRGYGVWLDAECSEVAEEFGCERMFMVGKEPRFASEMAAMAARVRADLIDKVSAANDNG